MKKDTLALFECGEIYHIYNHGNAADNLFLSDDNYRYFLNTCFTYINPFADILAWCLMPNHFHLLVRIHPPEYFFAPGAALSNDADPETINKWISKQFSNCYNSYAKAFNKQHRRIGSLFRRQAKRIQISDERYLRAVILYIHNNPVHHGFRKNCDDWKHSSYHSILTAPSFDRIANEVIDLFGGAGDFASAHQSAIAEDIHALQMMI